MENQRGYFGIGLCRPKVDYNIGHVLRACHCFGASFMAIENCRCKFNIATNVNKTQKHMPVFKVEDLKTVLPFDCVPIAIDLVDGAKNLYDFVHPERAFYIFGPEDGILGKSILSWCKYSVYIPTNNCLNLSMCANIVCYDRNKKMAERHLTSGNNDVYCRRLTKE